ncbi:MAG: GTP-binding protein, partial [Pseudomonadota bacterium]
PKFLKHFHHHHHHDHVTSFSITSDAPVEPELFFAWIQSVAEEFGENMLRMKGIIAFENHDNRYVMQGIHMHLEGDHQRPWKPDEQRVSRLVFIGRGLPRDIIEEGFRQCIIHKQVAAE